MTIKNNNKTAQSNMVDPLIVAVSNRSTVFARWRQCACQSNNNSLRQSHSALGSLINSVVFVGPITHSSYTLQCTTPFFPNICPFPWGICTPLKTYYLEPTPPTIPKRQLNCLSHFQNTQSLQMDRQTNRMTTEIDLY